MKEEMLKLSGCYMVQVPFTYIVSGLLSCLASVGLVRAGERLAYPRLEPAYPRLWSEHSWHLISCLRVDLSLTVTRLTRNRKCSNFCQTYNTLFFSRANPEMLLYLNDMNEPGGVWGQCLLKVFTLTDAGWPFLVPLSCQICVHGIFYEVPHAFPWLWNR